MLLGSDEPEIEIKAIRQGIITRAYLAVVRFGDDVRQKSFPVEVGSGQTRAVYMASYNWARAEAKTMSASARRAARQLAKSRVILDMMIEDTEARAAQVRIREEMERKAEQERHRKAVHAATVSLRYALERFAKGQDQMKASYTNVYGELARCPW
jgi:hypothetical protein